MGETRSPLARRLGVGAVTGLVAWGVGLVLTLLVVQVVGFGDVDGGGSGGVDGGSFGGEFDTRDSGLLGLVYFGAHFVDTQPTPPVTDGFNFVTELADGVDPAYRVLFLVPPLVLVLAGAAVAALDGRPFDGPLVAVGYFPACLLGVVLFQVEGDTVVSFTLAVGTIPAAIVAGAAYPLVLGLLGGVVARVVGLASRARTG